MMKIETYKLKSISDIVNGGTPSTKNPDYWGGDITWITPKDLSTHEDKYIFTGERSITQKGLEKSSARLVPKNTILFSSRAPIGYVALAGKELCTNQGFKNFVCNSNVVDYNYLYYWLIKNTEKIKKRAMGSTFSEISKTAIGEITISLPPLSEQKRIANILSSFDNKIELLREQNKTLENIAQTIFKQWFIDFNFPNDNGKPYKDSGGKMVDSELGMIPEGWKVGKLKDYIEFTNGYAFKSKDFLKEPTQNSYKIFKMGNIKKGGGMNPTSRQDYINKDNCRDLSEYILKKGDLLMSMTDMKDKISLLGHTALMSQSGAFIVNQRVGLLRSKNKQLLNYPYLYILTNNDPFLSNLRNKANSGVQVNLSTQAIKESSLLIPSRFQLKNFNNIAEIIFEKVFFNEYNIEVLNKTKTSLLNKLIK